MVRDYDSRGDLGPRGLCVVRWSRVRSVDIEGVEVSPQLDTFTRGSRLVHVGRPHPFQCRLSV